MDERLRFVARLLEGEKMAPLCAEFGISRKTGYKIFERYKDCGVAAFSDRSRRPYRQANRLPPQLEAVIVRLKREYPGWGAPEDPREAATAVERAAPPGHQHRTRGARPPWPGEAPAPAAARRDWHHAVTPGGAQRPLVRRLQRRVHARRSALLLSADDHRLRQPLPADVRGALDHAGEIRLHRLRADVQGIRAARRDSHRQRRAVRVRARALRPQQTGRVVAAARD